MGETTSSTNTTISLADEPSDPSRWSRSASMGLLMEATAPALLLGAGLIWGLDVGEEAVFFALPIVAGIGGSRLVRSPKTLWKVLGIGLGVLIALMLFWTAFGLAEPASFFDFVPGLLIVPGVLITLVAGIASIRSKTRDATSAGAPSAGEARTMRGALVALGVLAALSAILTVSAKDSVTDADAAGADVVVDMKDFEFGEDTYDATAGATILVKNSDPFLHTFTIQALDIDVEMTPGSEELITIPSEAGTYVIYCRPHTSDPDDPSKDDMAAKLTIG